MSPTLRLPSGPDKPPAYPPQVGHRRGAMPKPKRKKVKLPGGGVAFAPGPKPNITGAGKQWKVGKPGGGKYKGWWVALPKKKKVVTPPKDKTTPPGPPAPPPGPYDAYPEWARRGLTQYDKDIARSESFGSEVQKWLSSVLAPIQAGHDAATTNYQNTIAGLPNAGNIAVPQVAGMQPGSWAGPGSPEAWKTDAARAQAAGYSTIQQGQSALQSFLADAGMGNLRSALEANFAGDLLRVSEAQKKEKREYMTKLDQFLEESKAAALADSQELARKSTNDWYDFVAQLTNAGVKLTDINMDAMNPDSPGSGGVVVQSQTRPTTPGYSWFQESPGVWRGVKLPATGGGAGGAGAPKTRGEGLTGPINPKQKVPPGYRKVKVNGQWYWMKKPKGSGSGSGSGSGLTPEQRRIQAESARDIWRGEKNSEIGATRYIGGISTGRVGNYTDNNGKVTSSDPMVQRYVNNVRFYRFEEALVGMMSPNRVVEVMRSILGSGNYSRYLKWVNNTKATGPYSLKSARRQRHV